MASRNSHCVARGCGKRPAENSKNSQNSCFWRFLGALFHQKLYRIFIKIWESKKFNRFFHRKNRTFSENFHFSFFSYISSPISESFIAQLLLHRALTQKLFFFWQKIFFRWEKSVELFGFTYFSENPIYFIMKKCPRKSSKTWIFCFFWIFGGTFTAPTGDTVGVPRCH